MMIFKMSLRLRLGWKQVVKWAIVAVLAVLLIIFFIRVAIWESAYYREMEGSERDEVATVQIEEREELIEVEPTEEEIIEYTVAPDRPRYLTIEALGVYNARIIPMGVGAYGELDTPNNIFDVGWYESSGKPGQGKTMLIDGHNGGPHVHGVFKDLPYLEIGDIIKVERGDGLIYRYSVVENNEIPLNEADAYMTMALRSPEAGKESVTLITCSGEWSQVQGTYLARQFVRAVLVNE